MTNPYGLSVMVAIYELVGADQVAFVWQTDLSSAELIAEFTARWGQPMGEFTAPFDPTDVEAKPPGVVMIYEDGAA